MAAPTVPKGSRSARPHPSRPTLTHQDVVDAALKLIDSDGLENFTMRALAKTMGVYPTALYYHVGSKAQLLAAVATRVFDEVVLPDEHRLGWERWLTEVAELCRKAMHRHPEIAQMAGNQMVVSTTCMPMVERIVGVLERTGFVGPDLVHAYNALLGFILGWTALELSAEPSGVESDWKSELSQELRGLDPNAYPALNRNMAGLENNAFMARYDSGRTHPMDDSFQASMRILLAGLRAQLSESGHAQ
ncbi:TetR/AcrR family transcriptional regulator C-terminal domain-containing protein [Sphaerisporangium sp. NPDC051017]|uniref:TetR/AcrR family transcriptional regulator n=1 Tax=Sphaerisporangium sp. NPDC051017 TaxID=3154636 RepID=UPI003441A402